MGRPHIDHPRADIKDNCHCHLCPYEEVPASSYVGSAKCGMDLRGSSQATCKPLGDGLDSNVILLGGAFGLLMDMG
ncbi:hypothetical protein Tco_1338809 [Tanacetum coccineum]